MAAGQLFEPGQHHGRDDLYRLLSYQYRGLRRYSLLFRDLPGPEQWIIECSGQQPQWGICLQRQQHLSQHHLRLQPTISGSMWSLTTVVTYRRCSATSRRRPPMPLARPRRHCRRAPRSAIPEAAQPGLGNGVDHQRPAYRRYAGGVDERHQHHRELQRLDRCAEPDRQRHAGALPAGARQRQLLVEQPEPDQFRRRSEPHHLVGGQ